MDKYKKIENLLYNYKMLKISIENLEKDIEFLEEEDGAGSINYDDINVSPTNKFSSVVENTVLSKTEKREYLERTIKRNKIHIENIDKAMEGLTINERLIIEEKYIEGKQWWQVAYKVGYSEGHSKRIRKEAIEKLIIGIYGENDTKMLL